MDFWDQLNWAIGGGTEYADLSLAQVAIRTVVVFFVALIILRLGKRRFMGGYSAFDIMLGLVVGSVMARTVTGAISIVNMVVVVGILMLLHWLLTTVSFYWEGFDKAVESDERELIVDGEIQYNAMKASKLTRKDLDQALRSQGHVEDPKQVRLATLERDGSITIVTMDNE